MIRKLAFIGMLLPLVVEAQAPDPDDVRHFKFIDTTALPNQLGAINVTYTSEDDDTFGIVDIPAITQFYLEADPEVFEIVGVVLGRDMDSEYSLTVDLDLNPLFDPPENEGFKRHRVTLGNQNFPNLCGATTMGPGTHEVLQIIVRGVAIGTAEVWIDRSYNRTDPSRSSFMSAWVGGNFLPPDCLGAMNVHYSIDNPEDCFDFCQVIATNQGGALNARVMVVADVPSDLGPTDCDGDDDPDDEDCIPVTTRTWHSVKALYR